MGNRWVINQPHRVMDIDSPLGEVIYEKWENYIDHRLMEIDNPFGLIMSKKIFRDLYLYSDGSRSLISFLLLESGYRLLIE